MARLVNGLAASSTAERYDPREGHWSSIPMRSHGKCIAASTIGGRVAAIGNRMELLDRWKEAAMLPETKCGFGLTWTPWSPDSLTNSADG